MVFEACSLGLLINIPAFDDLVFDDLVFDDLVFDDLVFDDLVIDDLVIDALAFDDLAFDALLFFPFFIDFLRECVGMGKKFVLAASHCICLCLCP